MSNTIDQKLIVIGDEYSGKTCCLKFLTENHFLSTYDPTVFNQISKEILIKNEDGTGNDLTVNLNIWDTAGQNNFDNLRQLAYKDSNIVLLFFSIDNPSSFKNISKRWIPELVSNLESNLISNIPILIVGCKKDLRDSISRNGYDDNSPEYFDLFFKKLAKDNSNLNIISYTECSSLTGENIDKLFYQATIQSLNSNK
ncbi:Rho family protein, partial [Ascoidea rubescens DSM 1968]